MVVCLEGWLESDELAAKFKVYTCIYLSGDEGGQFGQWMHVGKEFNACVRRSLCYWDGLRSLIYDCYYISALGGSGKEGLCSFMDMCTE